MEHARWLAVQLEKVLGFPCEEIAENVLSQEVSQGEEYLKQFLGEGPETVRLCREVKQKLQHSSNININSSTSTRWSAAPKSVSQASGRIQTEKGQTLRSGEILHKKDQPKEKVPVMNNNKSSNTQQQFRKLAPPPAPLRHSQTPVQPTVNTNEQEVDKKRRSYSACQCMGTRHNVVGNCLACGKIMCTREGKVGYCDMRCTFCGEIVAASGSGSANNMVPGGEIQDDSTETSKATNDQLMDAVNMKNKLLMYDRTSAARTQVLDDQSDYFSTHDWLTEEEKKAAEEKDANRETAEQRRRRPMVVSFDIMGRKVVQQAPLDEMSGTAQATGDDQDVSSTMEMDIEAYPVGWINTEADHSGTSASGGMLAADGLRGKAMEVYQILQANLERQRVERLKLRKTASAKSDEGENVPLTTESIARVQHNADGGEHASGKKSQKDAKRNRKDSSKGDEKQQPGNAKVNKDQADSKERLDKGFATLRGSEKGGDNVSTYNPNANPNAGASKNQRKRSRKRDEDSKKDNQTDNKTDTKTNNKKEDSKNSSARGGRHAAASGGGGEKTSGSTFAFYSEKSTDAGVLGQQANGTVETGGIPKSEMEIDKGRNDGKATGGGRTTNTHRNPAKPGERNTTAGGTENTKVIHEGETQAKEGRNNGDAAGGGRSNNNRNNRNSGRGRGKGRGGNDGSSVVSTVSSDAT